MSDTPQDTPTPEESAPVIRLAEAEAYVIRAPEEPEILPYHLARGPETPKPARRKGSSLGLLASMAAMMGATSFPGMGGAPRVDKASPDYVKTPEDLVRMEAARAKRERKKGRNKC